MDIMDKIRSCQLKVAASPRRSKRTLRKHMPEMLYIGCIDARLDPIKDIGIALGAALIHRTIAALVAGVDKKGRPHSLGEAATVEFAVNVMKVEHIVVAGHTHCGGLQACLKGCSCKTTEYLHEYLVPLNALRKVVLKENVSHTAQSHALEENSVKMSLKNLMSYPFIKKAVKEGRLILHGWVIDTATKRISELDTKSGKFKAIC